VVVVSLTTPLCARLRIRLPIVQAPMGTATCAELAAAVSNAGGLGMLGITWWSPTTVAAEVGRTRDRTTAPFGVNVSLDFDIDRQVEAALELGVDVVSTFWGDPAAVHERIASAGATHLHTVGSPEDARRAVDAGADVVVAQGWEAGGHVWGDVATLPLVPAVVDAVDPVPVIAAGGIADGRGVAAVLILGAQAAWLGTRFLATTEANIHDHYRARIMAAAPNDAIYTRCFDGGWPDAPHRTLRNDTLEAWEAAGRPASPDRPGEGTVVATDHRDRDVKLYDDVMPSRVHRGNLDGMALYAGQSVGLVRDVEPAAQVVATISRQAEQALSAVSSR
jgi:NAD(P)H-dependent flavin oxidoreductase YrpB (nitropropane dioxygenase family)